MYGACDDCGNSLGECTCEGGPGEDLGRAQRGPRGHMVVTVKADPDIRRMVLQEVEKVRSRAVVLDAGPKASPETRQTAVKYLEDSFHFLWGKRQTWERVHWARDILRTAGYGDTPPTQLRNRQEAVAQIRALVWLMRLARLS